MVGIVTQMTYENGLSRVSTHTSHITLHITLHISKHIRHSAVIVFFIPVDGFVELGNGPVEPPGTGVRGVPGGRVGVMNPAEFYDASVHGLPTSQEW